MLTSFGLSSSGGINAGHVLGILALLSVSGALLAARLPWLSRARPYLSQLGFSFSFFLMWVPGIAETLTRLPVTHPLADGPQSPLVRGALAAWFAFFVVGSMAQLLWLRSRRRSLKGPVG
ncbi:hypothetical protein D9M69_575650 [compost metagenome]